jgi:hypothetical protein
MSDPVLQALVHYKGQTLNLLDPSGLDDYSLIVQEEVDIVKARLEVDALSNGYQQLDLLLQIALNGVSQAKETNLQKDLYKLRRMFVDLVGDSLRTVQLFEAKSREAARTTTQAFRFLFKGKEAFALTRLASCERLARDMENKARALEKGFSEASDKLDDIVLTAIDSRGHQEKANDAAKVRRLELDSQKQQAQERRAQAFEQAERRRRKDEELRQLEKNENRREFILDFVAQIFHRGRKEKGEGQQHSYRAERQEGFEKTLQQLKEATECQTQMIDIAQQLKRAADGEALTESVITALHGCITACQNIVVTIGLAVTYWQHTAEFCNDILHSQSQIASDLKLLESLPLEERLVEYKDPVTVEGMARYLGRWQAMALFSTEFKGNLEGPLSNLRATLTLNPTAAEGRANLKALLPAFESASTNELSTLDQRRLEIEGKISEDEMQG